MTFFGLMGFFTFFQVLASISRDFLDRAGSWKAIVIAVTVLIDVPILWWFGRLVAGIAGGGSDWWLVTSWMPFHFFAAFFAWGLREIFHSPAPQQTATPSASDTPTDPAETENPSESEDTEADTPTEATAVTEVDTDKQ
nr:protein CrcB-like protein [Schaalia odontolytica]